MKGEREWQESDSNCSPTSLASKDGRISCSFINPQSQPHGLYAPLLFPLIWTVGDRILVGLPYRSHRRDWEIPFPFHHHSDGRKTRRPSPPQPVMEVGRFFSILPTLYRLMKKQWNQKNSWDDIGIRGYPAAVMRPKFGSIWTGIFE